MILDKYVALWRKFLTYNNMDVDCRKFSILLFYGTLALGVTIAIINSENVVFGVLMGLVSIAAIHGVVYTYFVLGMNSRAAKVEEVLPDFLSLVASNIRAGITPDKALIVSARDEFGPLTQAVAKAGKSSITGMPFDAVLLEMNEHINSNVLEKTIRMIVEGLHSGGDMANLLEKTALDIRKFRSVRREISSIILNYVLFIMAAITFGAPMLYSVSGFLVDIMLKIREKIGSGSDAMTSMSGSVSIFKGNLLLTSDGVMLFSAASIIVTIFFGCIAVGVMSSGKRSEGLKYFPILTLIGLGLLFGIKFVLGGLLGGMLAGT